MTDLTLTVERTINAPQEAVFNAWLDPEMLRHFMLPAPGMTVPRADTDPREGGRFTIVMQGSDDEMPHSGTYKEIRPHRRIVFTWESPFAGGDSEVTLDLEPRGKATHLTLTHIRFETEESRDNHQEGWTNILSTLDEALSA